MITCVLILILDIGQTSRCNRIYVIVARFHLFLAKEFQCIYKSGIVFLWYAVVYINFGVLMTKTSKNGIADFFSISLLNLILFGNYLMLLIWDLLSPLLQNKLCRLRIFSTFWFWFPTVVYWYFQILPWQYLPVPILKGNPWLHHQFVYKFYR